jgi:hypothetical protein
MSVYEGEGIQVWPSEACRRFDLQLQPYLEGEDRPELIAHAAECAFCAAVLADLLLVRDAAGAMGPEEPPARVWANVRTTLAEEGLIRPRRQPRRAWADWFLRPVPAAGLAALLLLGFLSLRTRGYLHLHPQYRPAPTTAQSSDPQLESSVAEMEHVFQAQSATLDPVMKLAYEKSLQTLDSEIQECRSSLEHEPGDGLAREYLASAYHQKARVLASALGVNDGR